MLAIGLILGGWALAIVGALRIVSVNGNAQGEI